jgi:hypoxanthine phosphoribosyltransferase
MRQLLTREAVEDIVLALAERIEDDERLGDDPLMLGVLNGAFMFVADLVRALECGVAWSHGDVAFIGVSSYGDKQTSSGEPVCTYRPDVNLRGRTILLVEDIVDSGCTIEWLDSYLHDAGAERVLVCSLLVREGKEHLVDFIGRVIKHGDFAFGYGLDLKHRMRGLPDIWVE